MDLTHIRRRRLNQVAAYTLLGAVIGVIYGLIISHVMDGELMLHSAVRGVFTGALIAGGISSFELLVVERAGGGLRRLPFLQLLAIKEMTYTAVILGGDWLGSTLFSQGSDPGFGFNRVTVITYIFSISATLLIVFIIEMSTLLGPGVLRDIMRGRYHRPRQERRLLVFLDMRGSTAIAEKIGDLAFHRLLNRFFTDLTEAVLAWGGIVHKYVGDEMIVTWPLDDGKDATGAYGAVIEAHRRIARLGDRYRAEFGVTPDFRAILHAGPVVAGEMGEVKREIVLLGDTVNTTAKIELVSKGLSEGIIVSADALAAVTLPAGITSRLIGNFALPGKSTPIDLYSIA
jgi:adenylate cyclase